MTAANTLIARLERVKATAAGAWIASCPAHEDKRPSLSVRQTDDRVLIHCWAGCGAGDVVAAVGLSLADLFERRVEFNPSKDALKRRPPLPSSRELIALLEYDLAVIDIAAGNLNRGERLTPADTATLNNAIADVRRVLDVCHAYP